MAANGQCRLGLGGRAPLLRTIGTACRFGRPRQRRGPLDVKDVSPFLHPMRRNWLDAAAELDLPLTDDFNGAHPEGLGCYQVTIRNGMRRSAADAFLRPALRRGNVHLETQRLGEQNPLRAAARDGSGICARRRSAHFAAAKREVLLCAGAVNSPQLLQLSGIGPARILAAAGIAPLFDNPSVGGNLQDHLAVVYSFKATQPTLNDELHSTLAKLRAGLRYLIARRGPLALSVNQFGGFARAAAKARARMCSCISIPSPTARAMRPASASKWMPFPGSICASSRRGRPALAGSTSRARTFAARRRLRPIIYPPPKTSPMWCTAAVCCRRLRARGPSSH